MQDITYIATATDYYGERLSVKVLADNARSSQHLGIVQSAEEAKTLVAQKLPGKTVTWVTPYRFSKELSCC